MFPDASKIAQMMQNICTPYAPVERLNDDRRSSIDTDTKTISSTTVTDTIDVKSMTNKLPRNIAGGQGVVVVVDPYSTGRYLVEELRSRSIPMVAVRSSLDLAEFWLKNLQPEYFLDVIDHKEDDMKQTLFLLSKYDVKHVVPGSEPGVMVADELADALGCPWNGGDTKEWRRNKNDMQERIRSQGLRAIGQIYSDDLNEMKSWCEQYGEWPVVVKPAMSGGCDGVTFCHNFGDVQKAVEENLSVMNVNGARNDKLLLQECLCGDEYIVDMVSNNGQHVLSGIWRYSKLNLPGINFQHSAAELLPATGEAQNVLVPYVKKCLDALHIVKGASHSEVIMTADGPCLVETGARMHGLKGPKVLQIATGTILLFRFAM